MPSEETKTPLSAVGFYAFPTELRQIIFTHNLAESWNGKATPVLIQALRRSKLYFEAVDIFVRTNSYKLCRGNLWSFANMSPAAISTISALEIQLSLWGSSESEIRQVFRTENLSKLKSIRRLILDTKQVLPNGAGEHLGIAYSNKIAETCRIILTAMNGQLIELRLLTYGFPRLPRAPYTPEIPPDSQFEYFGSLLVDYLNSQLEQHAVLTRVETSSGQEWVWRGDGPGDFIRLSGG